MKNPNFDKIIIFDDVTLGDLLKKAYTGISNHSAQIDELMEKIEKYMSDDTGIAILGPILNNFVNSSVTNNEQLLKLVNSIHKLISLTTNRKSAGGDNMLSEDEKKQLLSGIEDITRTYKRKN